MNDLLLKQLEDSWKELRIMTYDLIDSIKDTDLPKKLSFERSKDIDYQLWCMTGAQESWLLRIKTGEWRGFKCSLDQVPDAEYNLKTIKEHMQEADKKLFKLLEDKENLLEIFSNNTTPLRQFINLVEHESHHHGQLINFIYAFDLEIPKSWKSKWGLSRD